MSLAPSRGNTPRASPISASQWLCIFNRFHSSNWSQIAGRIALLRIRVRRVGRYRADKASTAIEVFGDLETHYKDKQTNSTPRDQRRIAFRKACLDFLFASRESQLAAAAAAVAHAQQRVNTVDPIVGLRWPRPSRPPPAAVERVQLVIQRGLCSLCASAGGWKTGGRPGAVQ